MKSSQAVKIENDFYRHIVLYAKGYYKKENTIDDLKIIIAKISESSLIENALLSDIYKMVAETYIQIARLNNLRHCLINIFDLRYLYSRRDPNKISVEEMINYLLGQIAKVCMQNEDESLIFDIGKPDYDILPKDKQSD